MALSDQPSEHREQRPDPQQLLDTIFAFITADTWDESRRIVEAHPELLSDEADALLGRMLEAEEVRRPSVRRIFFEHHRAFLRRCREVGVERAEADGLIPKQPLDMADRRGVVVSGDSYHSVAIIGNASGDSIITGDGNVTASRPPLLGDPDVRATVYECPVCGWTYYLPQAGFPVPPCPYDDSPLRPKRRER